MLKTDEGYPVKQVGDYLDLVQRSSESDKDFMIRVMYMLNAVLSPTKRRRNTSYEEKKISNTSS